MANKLWDDVRTSLQDIGNLAAEKGREFSKAAADKAEELTRVGKIRLDLVQVNREIERLFSELGGKVYHLHTEETLGTVEEDEEVRILFEKISALEERKNSLDKQLEDIGKTETTTTEKTTTGFSEESENVPPADTDIDTESDPEDKQAE